MEKSRIPMYVQIQNDIKDKIVNGTLTSGDKIPSEQELMEIYKVSRITVSNALRKMSEEGWIYRVPGKGSFVNKNILQLTTEYLDKDNNKGLKYTELNKVNKSSDERYKIGVVIPFITDTYTNNYINGIIEEFKPEEYSILLKITRNEDDEIHNIKELLGLGVDGMLIFPYDRVNYNEQLLAMKLNNFPFVLIDRYLPGIETNYVTSDNYKAGRLAALHLIELGHRNICLCTGIIEPNRTQSIEDRVKGYYKELANHGIVINSDFFIKDIDTSIKDFEQSESNRKLLQLIKEKKVSAIITLSSGYALYVYSMLKACGFNVPEDVSIVSFDNPMPNCQDLEFFTYIDQSEYEQGHKAARILKDLLSNNTKEKKYRKEIFEPKIVIRNSTSVYKE